MNEKCLPKIKRTYVLFIGLLSFLATSALNAQTNYGSAGTSNSRLVASIEEAGDNVTVKVYGIGKMSFDVVEYALLLKGGVFDLTNRNFTTTYGYGRGAALYSSAIDPNPAIQLYGGLNVQFTLSNTTSWRQSGSANNNPAISSINGWDALTIDLGNQNSTTAASVDPGKVLPIFTCYLKKKISGTPISAADFGIGTKDNLDGIAGGIFFTRWILKGYTLAYAVDEETLYNVQPNLFRLRSPSSVTTVGADSVDVSTSVLRGNFQRGAFLPAQNLVDGFGNNAKLDWDTVSQRGFIYTTQTCALEIKEFTNTLLVNGVSYAFPNADSIAAGHFTCGTIRFNIVAENNTAAGQSISFSKSLTGLTANTQYYAWAFIKYAFQTSDIYPKIGGSITFTTEQDCTVPSTPVVTSANQSFCSGATVADLVATVDNGTTLTWFRQGIALTPTTSLVNGASYFAKAIDRTCVSSDSAEVSVTIKSFSTASMITASDVTICSGTTASLNASAGAVTSPVYKWYANETIATALYTGNPYVTPTLTDTTTYYVSVSGSNYCEGQASLTGRKAVRVLVKPTSSPSNLTITGSRTICSGQSTILTAAASGGITSPVYKWYSNPTGGTPFYTGSSYRTSLLEADTTFYVTVSGTNYCEGSVRDTVQVTLNCFTLRGTVVPFVNRSNQTLNALFAITARLYRVPGLNVSNPVDRILGSSALLQYTTTAVPYDTTVVIPGTPKNPIDLVNFNFTANPPAGAIKWGDVGQTQGVVDNTTLRLGNNTPSSPIGVYTLTNVAPGNYVLVLSRAGYVPRFAKITVGSGNSTLLGHRELIGGDINNDLQINALDVLDINNKSGVFFGQPEYDAKYDIDGNGQIDNADVSRVKFYLGFTNRSYVESDNWLKEYENEDD